MFTSYAPSLSRLRDVFGTPTDGQFPAWDDTDDRFEFTDPSGGGAPTVMVAASNATAAERGSADYVCDGTADDVEIQQALDAIEAAGGRGRLLLSSGTFSIAAALNTFGAAGNITDLSIAGMGMGATVLEVAAGAGVFEIIDENPGGNLAHITLADLTIDGNGQGGTGIRVGPSGYQHVTRCRFTDLASGVHPNSGLVAVIGCVFTSCTVAGVRPSAAARVAGCYFLSCDRGVYAVGTDAEGAILDNQFVSCTTSPIEVHGGGHVIVGNRIEGGGADQGIEASAECVIVGNVISDVTGDGIHLLNDTDALIAGNVIEGFGDAGVQIAGSSSARCAVLCNKIRDTTAGRTGVLISTGVVDTVIAGNDLRGCPTPISDSGTGTITSWPAHATYGDNFS